MIDVALIEIEGVLFETAELRRSTLSEALHAHGMDAVIDPDLVDGWTSRAAAAAALAGTSFEHDDVLMDLIALSAERAFAARVAMSGVGVNAGARAFVEHAAAHGRIGVVTRMSRADAATLLRLADLDQFVTTIFSRDDVFDAKPSPEGYRVALSRLRRQRGDEPLKVIALEDGTPGIRAAHAAGLRCVAAGAVPPHVAMEADGYVAALDGQTLRSLELLSAPGRERVQ